MFLTCSREDLGKVAAEIAQQEAQHRQLVVQVRVGMVLFHTLASKAVATFSCCICR